METYAINETKIYSGRGIGKGAASGRLKFHRQYGIHPQNTRRVCGSDEEISKLRSAVSAASDELYDLYSQAKISAGENEAEIFEIHRLILEDNDLIKRTESLIRDGYSAGYSILQAADQYAGVFASIDDEYLSSRAADIRAVALRVAKILNGDESEQIDENESSEEKYILVADDLTPGETVQLDRERIMGFVTFGGSQTSHTAILARALGIPAVIGTGTISKRYNRSHAIIDAEKGLLYISPDERTIEKYNDILSENTGKDRTLSSLIGEKAVTKSGKEIKLYSNIGSVEDAKNAVGNDAEGIGLLRTELLFLNREDCPSEEELFENYKSILTNVGGRPVIIRTLDIGADKKVSYLSLDDEENPALGVRGVRLTLKNTDIFKSQLRAIFRASVYGNVSIMLPMIVSCDEVLRCRSIIDEVKRELAEKKISFADPIKLGIMIETPAAAVMSDELAKLCDFFSVGTNDLIQYTLAADRQNQALSDICDNNMEPVIRLISIAADNAHKNGIWLGICGEAAADESLTQRFIDIGVDELSVSPPYILQMRKAVRNCN